MQNFTCRLVKIVALMLIASGCKSTAKSTADGSQLRSVDLAQSGFTSWDEAFFDAPQDQDARAEVARCLSDFGMKAPVFAAWPKALRDLLAAEAESLPIAADILKGVRGLYLVVGMKDFSGLACGAADGATQVVVFDEKVFVTRRKALGDLGKELNYPKRVATGSGFVAGRNGDFALDTFVHELMHVYARQRQNVFRSLSELSWESANVDKFGITAKLGLTDAASDPRDWAYQPVACRRRGELGERDASELGLADDPRQQALKRDTDDGALHRKLIETTNFIDQYSSTNAHEDFAETAAIFWRGMVRADWPKYDYRERTKDNQPGAMIFTYDPKTIVEKSTLHHKKICRFAAEVFGMKCPPQSAASK